jgi:hypothetical protein
MTAVVVAVSHATPGRRFVVEPHGHLTEKSPALHRAFFVSGGLVVKSNPPVSLNYVLV